MITNVIGELGILGYFIYLTIRRGPSLQVEYKTIIIVMRVIFGITFILIMLNILYRFIWWIIKRRRTKVVNFEKEYPKYTHQDDKVAA